MVTDMIKSWVAKAPVEALQAKLAEYAEDDGRLSPRDAEARTKLRSAIRAELARRQDG